MQLGTRWTAGDTPPAAVPEILHAAIRSVEESLLGDGALGTAPKWTLTFLERVPIAELDTGVIVTLDTDGEAVVRHDVDDEFA